MENTNVAKRPRITTLDSLRGFASVAVVLGHILGFEYYKIIRLTPFYMIRGAHEAVIFFFLLSGYVLTYQYASNSNYSYWRFLLQRICRIYVPYIFSIVFCIVLLSICNPIHLGRAWIQITWRFPIDYEIILKHFIFVGNFNTDALNPVIWSLVHEMRMAIIFPVLLYALKFKPVKAIAVVLTISGIAFIAIALDIENSLGYCNSYSYTGYYFYIFFVGALIARYQQQLTLCQAGLSTYKKTLLLIGAILLYNYSNLIPLVLGKTHLPKRLLDNISMSLGDFLITLASCYFIVAAINVSGNKMLNGKFPLFLGRISYSLYLIHIPVLAFMYFTLYGKVSTAVILGSGFLVSLVIAVMFNKYIEKPSIKMAKQILLRRSAKGDL